MMLITKLLRSQFDDFVAGEEDFCVTIFSADELGEIPRVLTQNRWGYQNILRVFVAPSLYTRFAVLSRQSWMTGWTLFSWVIKYLSDK